MDRSQVWSLLTLGDDRQYGGNLGYEDEVVYFSAGRTNSVLFGANKNRAAAAISNLADEFLGGCG